ncbi:MAG: hypothetical protein M3Q46_02355 [Verrucomicrobiota bacterium]|nr:hypothetical protein [Verrucomicrobiota bacterium]
MPKATTEMPSKAQHSGIGIVSTKPCGGGLATAGAVVRTTGTDGTLAGWMLLSLTVDFIGESAVAPIRAVSLRGPAGDPPRSANGLRATGALPGLEGEAGRGADGGVAGGFQPAGGGGGIGVLAAGGGSGDGVAGTAGCGVTGLLATARGGGGNGLAKGGGGGRTGLDGSGVSEGTGDFNPAGGGG